MNKYLKNEYTHRPLLMNCYKTSIIENNLPQLELQKKHLIISDKIVKCWDKVCNWLEFRKVCRMQLSISYIKHIVHKGKTSFIKGVESKAGKKFDAYSVLSEKAETFFEF